MIVVLFYSLSWILQIFSFSGCHITISSTNFKSMQRENIKDSASYTNYMHLNWIHNCKWVFGSHQQNCLIIPCASWPFLSINSIFWIYRHILNLCHKEMRMMKLKFFLCKQNLDLNDEKFFIDENCCQLYKLLNPNIEIIPVR